MKNKKFFSNIFNFCQMLWQTLYFVVKVFSIIQYFTFYLLILLLLLYFFFFFANWVGVLKSWSGHKWLIFFVVVDIFLIIDFICAFVCVWVCICRRYSKRELNNYLCMCMYVYMCQVLKNCMNEEKLIEYKQCRCCCSCSCIFFLFFILSKTNQKQTNKRNKKNSRTNV